MIGPAKKGRSVVILGDTRKTDEAAELAEGRMSLCMNQRMVRAKGKSA
ncbi:Uncharacterised protein [Weissella viridescens]|uniref:Uncharacterized protein n=1 Tax=Weissella viridescens TaxID=1629 RepID=A0A380P3D2_WEIVI|nr:Uncharacterised protein [Weissella viridescens]